MKTMLAAAVLAATTLVGLAAAPATASAQPYGRHESRFDRHHRHHHAMRICRHGRCYYR